RVLDRANGRRCGGGNGRQRAHRSCQGGHSNSDARVSLHRRTFRRAGGKRQGQHLMSTYTVVREDLSRVSSRLAATLCATAGPGRSAVTTHLSSEDVPTVLRMTSKPLASSVRTTSCAEPTGVGIASAVPASPTVSAVKPTAPHAVPTNVLIAGTSSQPGHRTDVICLIIVNLNDTLVTGFATIRRFAEVCAESTGRCRLRPRPLRLDVVHQSRVAGAHDRGSGEHFVRRRAWPPVT